MCRYCDDSDSDSYPFCDDSYAYSDDDYDDSPTCYCFDCGLCDRGFFVGQQTWNAKIGRDKSTLINNIHAITSQTIVLQMTYFIPRLNVSIYNWGLIYDCPQLNICYHLLGSTEKMISIKYDSNRKPREIFYLQSNPARYTYNKNQYSSKKISLRDTKQLYMNVYIPRTYLRCLPNDICNIIQKMVSQ